MLIDRRDAVDMAIANTGLEGLYVPKYIKDILSKGLEGGLVTTEDIIEMIREDN